MLGISLIRWTEQHYEFVWEKWAKMEICFESNEAIYQLQNRILCRRVHPILIFPLFCKKKCYCDFYHIMYFWLCLFLRHPPKWPAENLLPNKFLLKPLPGKNPARATSFESDSPTKVTNQRIWANHSTCYRSIQVISQSDIVYHSAHFPFLTNDGFLQNCLGMNYLTIVLVTFCNGQVQTKS